MVCHSFYLQTWVEAFNAVGVDSSFELRNLEKVFYSPAIRACPATQPSTNTIAPIQTSFTENPPPKSNTIVLAKPKSVEQPTSKSNAIAPQSSEVATKTSPVEESSFKTKVVPLALTPTNKTQPSKEVGKQKTPNA